MKVILNYDPHTGLITDSAGMIIITWVGLNYEPVEEAESNIIGGEQLIRMMKIAAHVQDAESVKDI